MMGRLFANLSFTSMYRMSVISATNVYFCREETTRTVTDSQQHSKTACACACPTARHLSVPDGVGGVSDDG